MASTNTIDSDAETGQSVGKETDPQDPSRKSMHVGYDIESGILARCRSWVDVFGWIRLGRVMRIAGSPIALGVTLVTLLVWLVGWNLLLGRDSLWSPSTILRLATDVTNERSPLWLPLAWLDVLQSVLLINTFSPGSYAWWQVLLAILWSIAVWAPVCLGLSRQGALLTAGRSMVPWHHVTSLMGRRYVAGLIASVVPALCVLMIIWPVPLVGWFIGESTSPLIREIAACLVVLLVIPAGLLAFGSIVAVPTAWSALMNERDPDPLDSLSRGYEYLYRRPLQLASYLIVSGLLLCFVAGFAFGLMAVGERVVLGALSIGTGSKSIPLLLTRNIRLVPFAMVIQLFWGLVGGIYLLLRQNAGGQDVDDLWVEPLHSPDLLPKLQVDFAEAHKNR